MTDEEMIEQVQGEKEEDIYTEEGREEEIESDAVDDVGAGFVEGYEEGERAVKCARCGKILGREYVEVEIGGEIYRFCSEECAKNFEVDRKEI